MNHFCFAYTIALVSGVSRLQSLWQKTSSIDSSINRCSIMWLEAGTGCQPRMVRFFLLCVDSGTSVDSGTTCTRTVLQTVNVFAVSNATTFYPYDVSLVAWRWTARVPGTHFALSGRDV